MPKISQLTPLTARTQGDVLAIVDSNETKQIRVDNLLREPVINAGNVSGAISVDLSLGKWFIFTLTGDVQVTLSNEKEGERFFFWVYANGAYSVTSMTSSSGRTIYCKGGNLPNPSNNAWNIYQANVIDSSIVLTEDLNFSAI